jgi:hypothetical protein
MVRVSTDIFQIVVLTTCSDTLLGINGSLQVVEVRRWIDSTQKDWLVLVHASVGEQQSRIIVWNNGRRGDKRVATFLKVLQEGVTDLEKVLVKYFIEAPPYLESHRDGRLIHRRDQIRSLPLRKRRR